MSPNYFNNLQSDVKSGKITVQEAVEKVAVRLQKDFGVFGLDQYDEDFRSAVIIEFLQRGHSVFERFDESYGQFFTYLYSFVKGLALTESKRRAKQNINAKVDVVHSMEYFFEMEERNDFTLAVEDSMCVPYAARTFSKPELEKTLRDFMAKRQYKKISKSFVVLALKACYDISDDEINSICYEFNINKEDFCSTIQKLKENLGDKSNKRDEVIKTRNTAYYRHMTYSDVFAENHLSTDYIKNEYQTKFNASTKRWLATNNKLFKGIYHLSPTNQAIADVLGISERQVCYYLSIFKDELEKIKNLGFIKSSVFRGYFEDKENFKDFGF